MQHKSSVIGRRDFVMAGTAAAAYALIQGAHSSAFAQGAKKKAAPAITMAKLPYAENALEPYISARTVNLHYTKHHKSYYDLVAGWAKTDAEYKGQSLEQIIAKTKGGILRDASIYYMAVLLYNHNFYWPGMKPGGGGAPKAQPDVKKGIEKSFGSYEAFRKKIVEKAMELGSGWVFLVGNAEGLSIQRMDYHSSPLQAYFTVLLALDVWEHAYYLDYLNDRERYVNTWLDKLLNWDFAAANLKIIGTAK